MQKQGEKGRTAGCPISRARCSCARRWSCSTSVLPDTLRHGSSTRHTWGFPWALRSGLVSLTHHRGNKKQKKKYSQTGVIMRFKPNHLLKCGNQKAPVYGAVHWCPHPLWQHFSLSGQSLSSEHSSAHIPKPDCLRGHTPGFPEGTRDSSLGEVIG